MHLLRTLDSINQKYGAWLFYAALLIMLLSEPWVYHSPLLTAHTGSLAFRVHLLAKYICYFRILTFCYKDLAYTIKCFAILVFLSYLQRFNAGDVALFWGALLIMASRGSKFKVTLCIFLFSFLAFMVIAFYTYLIGWSSDIVKHRGTLIGHSWGFSNPNMLAYILQMATMVALIVSRTQKLSYITSASVLMAVIICFCTWSLTSAMLLVAFPIIYFALRKIQLSPYWLACIPPLLLLLSCLLSFYYGPSEGETTFESRFSIPAMVYVDRGVSFFGQDCHLVSLQKTIYEGTKTLWIDNMYHYLILIHGIIPALLTILFFSHLLYRIGRFGSPLLQAAGVCLMFNALTETLPCGFLTDFALFYYLAEESTFRNAASICATPDYDHRHRTK